MRGRFWAVLFIIVDWITALFSWSLFFYLRKTLIEKQDFELEINFYLGIFFIPLAWLMLYALQGTYYETRRMFRIRILNMTFLSSLAGSILIFFTLLLDDEVRNYQDYYQSFLLLFGIHFFSAVTIRLILTSILVSTVRKKGQGFKTLIVGGNEKALEIYQELFNLPKNVNEFVGYVNINGVDHLLKDYIPNLGKLTDLEMIIEKYVIEEVIIAIESSDHDRLKDIIVRIDDGKTKIKVLPDMYVILAGSVKMTNIYGALLIEITSDPMPYWQRAIKRVMDIVLSFVAVILLIPFYIFSAIAVKMSSPGPILFLQERVGINGKQFKIIKFRTMFVNSEAAGPQLSSSNDPRITKIGRFMRKTRLDEFPQFINVLLGDMSLVGPRPERQFYIDQIVKIEPQYLHLNRVRPGITSWGQVKYGYAENVDQMLQRMKFDLIYLKNRSLALDIKIMFYTIIIVIKAKGK
ncbi:MAG: sugar transferase [Flavobacteriales bacterium]|nr:sugar transferase [Flavobacteriales bacterium]